MYVIHILYTFFFLQWMRKKSKIEITVFESNEF